VEVSVNVGALLDRLMDRRDMVAHEAIPDLVRTIRDAVLRHVQRNAQARVSQELAVSPDGDTCPQSTTAPRTVGLCTCLPNSRCCSRASNRTAYRP